MLQDKLGVDEKDIRILSMFMADPDVSQIEIANSLNISQPSVNARVHRLRKKGLLTPFIGIDLNKTDMYLARIDFTTPNAEKILNELKMCSFFVNGFVMSGKDNVSIFIVGYDLKKIEAIINKYLRSDPMVKDINMSVVVSAAKPFVSTLDIERERNEVCQNVEGCEECNLHKYEVKREIVKI